MSYSDEFLRLARDLHKMPPATLRQMRKAFRAAGEPMAADARRRASWSSRIPGAIAARAVASESQVRIAVELRAAARAAPHARPYEGITGNAEFRHPVFGRGTWVPEGTRPYLKPAAEAAGDRILPAIGDAYEAAARECGFR